jgi:hypothetical protein
MVIDARRVSPITATNAIAVRDTPEHIAAAGRVIAAIDKARPEVIIDVPFPGEIESLTVSADEGRNLARCAVDLGPKLDLDHLGAGLVRTRGREKARAQERGQNKKHVPKWRCAHPHGKIDGH